jgi:hypothetical protein
MCDSAAMVLQEIHNLNDSLLIEKYFYENKWVIQRWQGRVQF